MDPTLLFKAADLLFKISDSSIAKEIHSIWKYEEELKMFSDTVRLIGAVLSDVEAKQFNEASVASGYKRLREAYLDAEDFLDRAETLKKQLDSDHRKLNTLHRFFTGSNPVKSAIKVHNEIKKNGKALNAIAQDLHKFGLSERTVTEARRVPETFSFVSTDNIIGRDDDKRKVIDLLLGFSADQEKIPVVSIVGIGGMGKTTLAQLVYNDESGLESGLFNLKMWVSDSGNFDLKLLLQKILLCISPDDTTLPNLGQEQLQNRLIREFQGKKYFLVLDDVRNEVRKHWLDLEELLNQGDKESRILVTTRSREVAMVMGSSSTYELKGLSMSDSWQLFENNAFSGRRDESLIEIGKVIVKKCSQVPLAIKTIGCLLFGKGKRKWEHVRDIDFSKIVEESNDLMPILKISYDDLDPTLKQCFQYCALLPRSAIISREILCCIWMANGCVKPNKHQDAEDVCDENLKILHNRCFLEEVGRNKWGDVTHFKMHDLMHDLAKEVAGTEMFVMDSDVMVGSTSNLVLEENILHVNLKSTVEIVDRISTIEPKNTRLRTLLHHDVFTWRNPWQKVLSIEKITSKYQVLRMLDLQKWRIESLTNSIGDLIHLRYLDLSYNEFKTLPDTIVELCNLQFLLLKSCTNLEELPKGTRKLINLKHLNLEGCNVLTHMPSGMGALTSLCRLNNFIVGPQNSKDSARLEDLEPLSKLQGDLTIKFSEKITLKKSGDIGALLLNKRLKKLKIEWPPSRSDENLQNDMEIFAKLQPHSDLEDFTLYGYGSLEFPLWVLLNDLASVLPNLVYIIIDQCTGCRHLPSFSQLRYLKRLTLGYLLSLEFIEETTSTALFFPSLEYLWLIELPELKGWCRRLAIVARDSEQEQSSLLPPFPHLLDLYIYGCPCLKMTSMPISSIIEFSLKSTEDEDVFTLKEEKKDSEAARASCTKFHTNDMNLAMSIPWEQYHSGKPVAWVMKVLIGFDIHAINMTEPLRRMFNHLFYLEIHNYPEQCISPEDIRYLTAQRELFIQQHMPGELKSTVFGSLAITELSTSLEVSQVGELPWEHLQSLQHLRLNDLPKMERLPEGIQYLTSLQKLYIENCRNLRGPCGEMPWKGFQSLQCLRLSHLSKMEILPEGIQFLTSLQELYIESCGNLRGPCGEMPWKGFQSLKCLKLSHLSKMERLPKGIQFLTSLQEIYIENCDNLTGPCDEMSWKGLQNLQHLRFSHLLKMDIPLEGIQFLTSLKEIYIGNCDNLTGPFGEMYRKGYQSLQHLRLTRLPKMEIFLEGIQFLTSLQELYIENCDNLIAPCGEMSWKGLQSLQRLRLSHLPKMEILPEGIQLLASLQELYIENCDNLSGSCCEMSWKGLQSLQRLSLSHLPMMEILPEGIQFLTSLQELYIENCDNLTCPCGEMSWKGLQSLQHLRLSHLPKMEILLEGISFLASLKELYIDNCDKLAGPCGEMSWKGLQNLQLLRLSHLPKVEIMLEGIWFLTSLNELCIENCDNVTAPCGEMSWKGLQSLEKLILIRLPKMERLLEGIQFLASLKELYIDNCDNLTGPCGEIPWKELQSLRHLVLSHFSKEILPEGIQFLTSLRELSIENCGNLTSPCGEMLWKGLRLLERLRFTRLPKMEILPKGIQVLTFLDKLYIENCDNLASLCGEMPWKGLIRLQCLRLSHLPKMEVLPEGIQFLTYLKKLYIENCENLTGPCGEIPWKGLRSLQCLRLSHLPKMEILPEGIAFLTSLQDLSIKNCDNLILPEWFTLHNSLSSSPTWVTLS